MRLRMMSLVFAAAVPLSAPVWAEGEIKAGDITFTGTVVGLPCLIETGKEHLTVDFNQVDLREIYRGAENGTSEQNFEISLVDCSPAVSQGVTVTFTGDADPELAQFLAIKAAASGGENATGIAIGIKEADDGALIPLGQASKSQVINGDTLVLNYKAFVRGTPSALGSNSITTGNFTATANFELTYQ